VDRDEWNGTSARYEALDDNRDGMLSRRELGGANTATDLFTTLDVNRDRVVSRSEWNGNLWNFNQRDSNRDGRLTRAELEGVSNQTRSRAYQAGYDRGTIDGREAGRGDRQSPWGFDPEGQRELEQADAGYVASLGSRAEYQAGYREGFRRAYPEGFRGTAAN
jgi:hypothetical protein